MNLLKPTNMKKIATLAIILISGLTFAQEKSPKLEEVDGMVKATYYYDNGQVQQEGLFKDGKLEGKWISYDMNGNKKSIAEYKNGEKTGKWFFWNDKSLAEVDYSKGAVASVKNWNKEAIADKN
jgi:antitoxin component YwqK of YwqJK toxin-antitoxin module